VSPAAVLLALTALPTTDPDYPDVCLADAAAFRGIDPQVARSSWIMANNHKGRMRDRVTGWNNTEDVVRRWEGECDWRAQVWYWIDDIRYCDIPVRSKLRALSGLKRELGEADYYAGRVPAPIPGTYRFAER
jgi:hypothetical protein